jgi:carbamoyltransferase
LRLVTRQLFPHSVGLFYAAITAWLGFRVLEGEQQVMGLSALGSPTKLDVMQRLARIHSDGSLELDLSCFAHHTDDTLGFSDGLVRLLGPPRRAAKAWNLDEHGIPVDAEDRHYADVAASAQLHTEAILVALARQARALCPDVDTLCLAGGVALNACANSVLAQQSGFARIFVQPAAGDAGGALGAAWNFGNAHGDVPRPLAHAAWGPALTASTVVPLARASGLVTLPVTPTEAVARLWSGQVLALVDGRSEWGPRALGHRSLLAAPGPRDVQHHINTAIKRREPFRPFAPAVLDDDVGTFFDNVAPELARFMTGVSVTRPAYREVLGAVTHHDGSARVQSVDAHAPALRAMLLAAKAAGHPPVLLNTSLNGRREPICQGAVDVVRFLLAHPDVNGVVIDDVLITRP